INGDLYVTARAVLEADRRRKAGRQLTVRLTLRGAGSDRTPRHQIGVKLWRDEIEELRGTRQPTLVHVEEQATREAQAFVNPKTVVETRIVDEALPTHRSARLLEVDPHDDEQLASVPL